MEQKKVFEASTGFVPDIPNLLGTTVVSESESINNTTSEISQQDQMYTSKRDLSIDHYCRLCGTECKQESLILIFSTRGRELTLHKKIFDHLHLEVKRNDKLPQNVCLTCISQLNTCQQLFETSKSADFKLRQIFLCDKVTGGESPISSDKTVALNSLEQDEVNAMNTEESEGDSCIKSETVFKKIKARKKGKQVTSVLCHICGKAFKDMANLNSHKRIHLPEELKKKYQCSMCQKSFRTNFHLSEHMNVHIGVTPYSCQDCEKQFHSRALLRQHVQVHRAHADDKNKVACPKCGLLCTRKGNLRAHLRTHQEGRTFNCSLCQRQFATFSEMLSHRKQHTQVEIRQLLEQDLIKDKDRIFTCRLCNKIFTEKRNLMTHMDRLHNDSDKKFKCPECGKLLNSKRSLLYHQRSQHTAERPFQCSFCTEGFMLLKLLKAHETKHTGERPFKCELCEKAFRSRNNLYQHVQKHGSDKRFDCIVCGKKFQRKAALDVHTRIHSEVKPFMCDVCGRGFTQKNDLLKHQRTHLEESTETHTCEQCMVAFSSKKELLKHVEAGHNDISVVPLIVTNNMFETHVITEDGQKIIFPPIDGVLDQNNIIISCITNVEEVQQLQ